MEVTYSQYLEEFGGRTIPEGEWKNYERLARKKVDQHTFGRADYSAEDAILCVCALADQLWKSQQKKDVKSENVDGYSVTYADRDSKKEESDIIDLYLGLTGWLCMEV